MYLNLHNKTSIRAYETGSHHRRQGSGVDASGLIFGSTAEVHAWRDARAEMRRTLELAAKGSVVLTTHGQPAAAVVPFATLEDMRRAL